MLKNWKRIAAAALAACLALALAACGGGGLTAKDAATYIQGDLDATYKGIYDQNYIDLVEDMTQADAEAQHQSNLEYEAEYLMSFLYIDYPDDAVTAKAQELVAEIYSNAKYTVGTANKLDNGDFAVEVTISPIEIVPLLGDEVYSDLYWDIVAQNGITTQEEFDALSEEEYADIDAQYGMAILEELEALLPDLTYGEDQSVMLQLKLDDDGYYSLVSTGYQKLDEIMIDYYGDYLQ